MLQEQTPGLEHRKRARCESNTSTRQFLVCEVASGHLQAIAGGRKFDQGQKAVPSDPRITILIRLRGGNRQRKCERLRHES